MVGFLKLANHFRIIPSTTKSPYQIPSLDLCRFLHSGLRRDSSYDPSSAPDEKGVAIFWDLDNKPPNSFPPYDTAVRLKIAASAFGIVRVMVAYANHHTFSYVPPIVRDRRKERKVMDHLENKGIIKPSGPFICRVCGRKFYTNEKMVNHFKQLHEREQTKRLNRLESSKGKRRVQLAAKYSMKMEKYKNVARDILTPKVGYGLGDELKRAGFWVRTVSDKPQAADTALRNHMVETMDRGLGCLVLVSDDGDFTGVLREAKLRCVRTVVVGDDGDGVLRRCADSGFSWEEVVSGKAKKEAASVVGRWKDRDLLKRLEWTYKPECELKESDSDTSEEGEVGDFEDDIFEDVESLVQKEDARSWRELDSRTNGIISK